MWADAWVFFCLFCVLFVCLCGLTLLTLDEISVSVGDDSCNKNEMNTVNAWLVGVG